VYHLHPVNVNRNRLPVLTTSVQTSPVAIGHISFKAQNIRGLYNGINKKSDLRSLLKSRLLYNWCKPVLVTDNVRTTQHSAVFVQPLLQWKIISITYSECVFVDLVAQHVMDMRHIIICGLYSIFPHYLKSGKIF